MKHKALNQLICAALINDSFRQTLLANPAQAVSKGYYGQKFSLSMEEQKMVTGIRAQKLEDFASQVYQWLNA
jgi:3,4-dihydroxy-2-butanone 4-phosphate synthase